MDGCPQPPRYARDSASSMCVLHKMSADREPVDLVPCARARQSGDMPHTFTRRQLLGTTAAALSMLPLATSVSAQVLPVPTPGPQQYSGFAEHTIVVSDGGTVLQRSFLAHVPLVVGRLVPAVIVFHGGGQTADDMIQHWESLLPTYQIAIVCPQSLIDPSLNATRWRHAQAGDAAVPTVDLAFVTALLDWLASTGKIDMQRVYAAGFSNGGGMTWQLTQLNAFVNRFRGFAPVAHVLNAGQIALSEAPARTTPKPVAYTVGTADSVWGTAQTTAHEPLPPDVVRYWILRNRTLSADPPVVYSCTVEQPVDPFGVEQLYRPNPIVTGSQALLWMTGVNAGHHWPGTGHDPSGRGLVIRDVDWTKRVVAFWNTYAGMGLPSSPAFRNC